MGATVILRGFISRMKKLLIVSILFAAADPAVSAPAPAPSGAKIRTFLDCSGLPRESLRSSVSAKFYKSLTISPLEAWIVVRAPLMNSRSDNAKVIRSEADGAFDTMALELAKSMHVSGMNYVESNLHMSQIMVHLLIYKIADGIMAVGFSHVEDSRYAGYRQYGRATIGFLQKGKWTFMDNSMPRR